MSEPLRLSGTLLVVVAVLAAVVAQMPFLDVESGTRGAVTNHDQVWGASMAYSTNATLAANETAPSSWHSYYETGLDSARGITLLRFAGPVLDFGLFVLLACLVLVIGRQSLVGGLVGVVGSFVVGGAILLFVIGLGDLNRATGDGLRFSLHFSFAFYILVAAAILGLAGSLLAIADPSGKKDEEQDPAHRIVLSVETPDAFNPLKSKDPVPFKPDPPREYKSFEVQQPKTFKPKDGPKTGAEGEWKEAGPETEGQPPATPSPPAGAPAKPSKPAKKDPPKAS
ncbi:MAG: hypothetical protein V4510_11330 [bacterium]